jgi:hypothetical protein
VKHRISLNRCCCADVLDPDPDPVHDCTNGWPLVYPTVIDSWHAADSLAGQNTNGRLTNVTLFDASNVPFAGSPQSFTRETFYGPTEWFIVNPSINGVLLFQQETLDWSKEGEWEMAFHGTSLFRQLLISGFFTMTLATNYSGDPVTLGASWEINSPCHGGGPTLGSGDASYPVPSYQFGIPMLGTSTLRLSFRGATQEYRVRIQTPTGAGGTDYDSGTLSYPYYFEPNASVGELEMLFLGDNRGMEYLEILNAWT